MAEEHANKAEYDIFPRDQVEHYKIELSRLQSENEHLSGEVEYLRQALAAALSKIPQLDAPASAVKSPPVAAAAAPEDPSTRDQFAALQPYAQYFSLASLVASPVLLLFVLLALALLCSIILAGGYFVLNL